MIPFQNILTVSSKLDSVEKLLDEKTRELSQTPVERQQQIKGEIDVLLSNRDKIQKQRIILEEKLQEGRLLSPVEERRYIVLHSLHLTALCVYKEIVSCKGKVHVYQEWL